MKKLIVILSLILIMALLPVAGCASTNKSTAQDRYLPTEPMPAPTTEGSMFNFGGDDAGTTTHTAAYGDYDEQSTADMERRIVKTGYMSLVVDDVEKSLDEISTIASGLGGYVVSSNKNEGDETVKGNIAIRVPADKYDEAISQLRDIAVQVPNESTDTQDVTEEYMDLSARLKTLEATEVQYLELLKKAETVEDMLKVQQALTNVRQDIEVTKGRIQYLERTSDMSLINISLSEEASFHEEGWQPLEILKSAVRGLATFGQVLINILIWIAVFIPLWAIIGVVVWLILRRRKKMKANQ
jgi:hypothetical protein